MPSTVLCICSWRECLFASCSALCFIAASGVCLSLHFLHLMRCAASGGVCVSLQIVLMHMTTCMQLRQRMPALLPLMRSTQERDELSRTCLHGFKSSRRLHKHGVTVPLAVHPLRALQGAWRKLCLRRYPASRKQLRAWLPRRPVPSRACWGSSRAARVLRRRRNCSEGQVGCNSLRGAPTAVIGASMKKGLSSRVLIMVSDVC